MKCGWSRKVTQDERQIVTYGGPCGYRMMDMDQVHCYLLSTGCELSVDLFCFENFVSCFTDSESVSSPGQIQGNFQVINLLLNVILYKSIIPFISLIRYIML